MKNKENWTVRGEQQRDLERLCAILVHTSATRFETVLADLRPASCQVPAKSLALPANYSVGSDFQQGEPDPEEAVEGGRNGSSPFSLDGGELKTKSLVLHHGGRMTAEEEPREAKHEPDEGWDQPQFLAYTVMKFKLSWADAVLANGTARSAFKHCSRGCMSILPDPSAPCRHSAHLTLSGYVSFDPTIALSVTFKTKQFAREIVRVRAGNALCLRLFNQTRKQIRPSLP